MNGIVITPGIIITMTSICAGVIGVAGFVIGNNRNESKARGRIYGRMDENKKEATDTFVRQDICSVVHKSLDGKIDGLCVDVKKLLQKNGLK